MRTYIVLGAAAVTLAACGGGGGGPETVGGVAVPGGTAAVDPVQFVTPTEPRTFVGVGGLQRYEYNTDSRNCCNQQAESYGGSGTRVRDSSIAITYDPRDATYILKITDSTLGVTRDVRFQDPANRTDFGGKVQPQWGTPNLANAGKYANTNIQYLQAGEGTPVSMYRVSGNGLLRYGTPEVMPTGDRGSEYQANSFFFEKPGTTTKYVTFAGYVSNVLSFGTLEEDQQQFDQDGHELERGAFAYGVLTDSKAIPGSGTATYTGNMLGTMVYNPTLDEGSASPTYFQWLTGASKTTVNFSDKSVQLALEGVVLAPQVDRFTGPQAATIGAGSTFAANGSAKIDMVQRGGFVGNFEGGNFTFAAPTGQTFANGATTEKVEIVGSSIDGAFFGPGAEEVGGGFRVVGGTPDQRIDIVGAFKGKQ
jgi:hypothetical protein